MSLYKRQFAVQCPWLLACASPFVGRKPSFQLYGPEPALCLVLQPRHRFVNLIWSAACLLTISPCQALLHCPECLTCLLVEANSKKEGS